MRAVHGRGRMDAKACNKYRIDGRIHVNRFDRERILMERQIEIERQRANELEQRQAQGPSRGINMSPLEFGHIIGQIQDSISSGIAQGLSNAVHLSNVIMPNVEMMMPADTTRRVFQRPNTNNFLVSINANNPALSGPTSTAVTNPVGKNNESCLLPANSSVGDDIEALTGNYIETIISFNRL